MNLIFKHHPCFPRFVNEIYTDIAPWSDQAKHIW